MAALFSACVRAPLTGIGLAVEMTGRGDLTLQLLAASLGAMVVAMVLKSEPIYESLKRRMLEQEIVMEDSQRSGSHARAFALQRRPKVNCQLIGIPAPVNWLHSGPPVLVLGYLATRRLFVTWKTPGTPLAAIPAMFLSPSFMTKPARVTRWFSTMM